MNKTFKSINSETFLQDCRFDDNYIEDLKVMLKVWSDAMTITDITNALKVGKTCNEYKISMEERCEYNEFLCKFYNWLQNNKMDISEFISEVLTGKQFAGVIIRKSEVKAINTYSPFVTIAPIKPPTKWTLPHVWKAILSGQIKKGVCDGVYTDDYAYDNAANFQKGSISVTYLAKKLIEHSSGWWVHVDKEENGIIQLSVNCHSFDTNTLFFETSEKKEIIPTLETKEIIKSDEPATKRQMFALHCICKVDTRSWQIDKAAASNLIALANSGANKYQVLDTAKQWGVM